MRELLLTLFVSLLAFCVLFYRFKVKAAFHFNVTSGLGFVSIKTMGVRLFSAKFELTEEGRFKFIRGVKKKKKKKKPKTLLMVYFTTLTKRLKVKKFELYFTLGSDKDAYKVSMICGYILALDAMFSAFLLDRYKHIKIFNDIDPIYDQNRLEASLSVVISFSLFDMLISVFAAYIKYFKVLKERRKNA